MWSPLLRTLTAVVDEGSFEGAAVRLRITPSAVSQRIRALEKQVGQLVVVRASPSRPTAAGEILLRAARAVRLLEDEAERALQARSLIPSVVPVAVNADSLATWFPEVFTSVARWGDVAIQLSVQDQELTADLLRDGTVLAAVSTEPLALPGCTILQLGRMRYLPVASRSLVARFGNTWKGLPVVRFGRDDNMHVQMAGNRAGMLPNSESDARTHTAYVPDELTQPGRVHQVPSAEGCLAAVRLGLGWGAVPELQIVDDVLDDVVVVEDAVHVDVPLYWHAVRLDSERLERVTAAVVSAARVLRPPTRGTERRVSR